jgi:hypothetical protein
VKLTSPVSEGGRNLPLEEITPMIYQSDQTGTTKPLDPASQQTDVLGNSLRALYRRLSLHHNLLERWSSTLQLVQTSAMS